MPRGPSSKLSRCKQCPGHPADYGTDVPDVETSVIVIISSLRLGMVFHPFQNGFGPGFTVRIVISAYVINAVLFEPCGDFAIICDHRIAPAALAETKMVLLDEHAHPACEIT